MAGRDKQSVLEDVKGNMIMRKNVAPNRTAVKKVVLLPFLVLLLASNPVRARKNPSRPFQLPVVVTLNGARVPAGIYELTCETHGSAARVTLWKDGRFVATAPGAWIKNGVTYSEDQVLLRVNSDGTKSLIEIRIAGATRAIVLSDTNVIPYAAAGH